MDHSCKERKISVNEGLLKPLIIAAVTLFVRSCRSQGVQSKGYENLDTLYADFVRYLKAGGDGLKTYCFRITPDTGTVRYWEKNNISYRGIPDELKKQKLSVNLIGEEYYKSVMAFREDLAGQGQLEDLVYLGRKEQGGELFDQKLKVYGIETFILLRSGSDTISCKLGEMFNFYGKWKSFTEPKPGW